MRSIRGHGGPNRSKGLEERHKGHIWGVLRDRGDARQGRHKIMSAVRVHVARVEGIEQIVLAVATAQGAAIALYQSVGFRSFGCKRRA